MGDQNRVIGSKAAAEILGVSERTIARWADDGVLKVSFSTRGGARRFAEIDVRELGGAKDRIEAPKEAPPLHLTSSEAARFLGVTDRTISRWVDEGRLTAQRTPGGHVRIALSVLESHLANSKVVPRAVPSKRFRSDGPDWNMPRFPRHRAKPPSAPS